MMNYKWNCCFHHEVLLKLFDKHFSKCKISLNVIFQSNYSSKIDFIQNKIFISHVVVS